MPCPQFKSIILPFIAYPNPHAKRWFDSTCEKRKASYGYSSVHFGIFQQLTCPQDSLTAMWVRTGQVTDVPNKHLYKFGKCQFFLSPHCCPDFCGNHWWLSPIVSEVVCKVCEQELGKQYLKPLKQPIGLACAQQMLSIHHLLWPVVSRPTNSNLELQYRSTVFSAKNYEFQGSFIVAHNNARLLNIKS